MLDSSLIGKELDEFPLPVERSKVREFARALLDDDPVYQQPDSPAPLTFAVAAGHFREDLAVFEGCGFDIKRMLHGESSWEYLAPVNVGDELTALRRVVDVTTRPGKRGGDMTLVTYEIEFVNQNGDTVLRQRDVLIQTGGK
jgi:hydroxyacyl-ACP dehydratase HTD2-like protein with hotdog domain